MNLDNVKAILLPEGNAKSLAINGATVWSASSSDPEPSVLYSWEHVLWSIANDRYTTDYSIGDLIPLDLGTEGNINMQIAGFGVDDLADGTGKAHISFVAKEPLSAKHRMNPSFSSYEEGTGAIGGWEKSEMRAYLKNTVKPLIQSEVRSEIVEVTKTQSAYDTSAKVFTQTTQDDVWLPSWDEISGSDAKYGSLFPDDSSRIKYIGESISRWWTRQASSYRNFHDVFTSGTQGNGSASNTRGVCLGFCL